MLLLGAQMLLLGAQMLLLGLLLGQRALPFQLNIGSELAAIWLIERQLTVDELEAHAQPRANPAVHRLDGGQLATAADPAAQRSVIGIVDVELLGTVALVE